MKKTTKYIALLLSGLVVVCFTACSEDEWTAGPAIDQNCISATFDGDNIGSEVLDDTDPTSITLSVTREKTDAAATVAVKVLANTEGVFSIPENVEFASGEATANLTVSFDKAELKKEYTFEIALDESAVNPYKGNGYARYTIQRLKWITLPGTFTFKDWTFSEYNTVESYDVTVQRVEGENQYRIVNPFKQSVIDYGAGTPKDGMITGKPDDKLFFTINPTSKAVNFDSYFTGYIDKHNCAIYGLSTKDQMGVADVDSKFDTDTHMITFTVYYYAKNANPNIGHLIGQKEATLQVPGDFALVTDEEAE